MKTKQMRVLVTGANGFVGKALCDHLRQLDFEVIGAVRGMPAVAYQRQAPALERQGDWSALLAGVDVVVHCAARVHVMDDKAADPLQAFRTVNRDGTLYLAKQAAQAGVKHFIFLSSIKVNGEATLAGAPFTETRNALPTDPYGLSKYEAEQALLNQLWLRELNEAAPRAEYNCANPAANEVMAVTVLRTPLIYGVGVKANFASMINWVKKGIPLPFADINNARSLLSLINLCDFIGHIVGLPKAFNQVFLVADPVAYSTTVLLKEIAKAYRAPSRLFYVNPNLINGLAKILKLEAKLSRLLGSLEIDISKARQQLDWQPPATLASTLNLMAASSHETH